MLIGYDKRRTSDCFRNAGRPLFSVPQVLYGLSFLCCHVDRSFRRTWRLVPLILPETIIRFPGCKRKAQLYCKQITVILQCWQLQMKFFCKKRSSAQAFRFDTPRQNVLQYPCKKRCTGMKTETAPYLACEQRGTYALLMMAAGMMGAYTYNLRGGVFCNAQTAIL